VAASDGTTKRRKSKPKPGRKPGRPRIRKDGELLTVADRSQRYRDRHPKSINRHRRTKRRLAKQGNAAELRRAAWLAAHSKNPEGMDLRIGDWREVIDAPPGSPHYIPDDSVALILTDPPYEKAADDHCAACRCSRSVC
jgi:hypothetical protein